MSLFSAVSTPIFASKYSLESSRRDILNALLCTALESTGEKWGKKGLAKTTPKRKKTRKREANKQRAASHLELRWKGAAKKIAKVTNEDAEVVRISLLFFLFHCMLNVECSFELQWIGISSVTVNWSKNDIWYKVPMALVLRFNCNGPMQGSEQKTRPTGQRGVPTNLGA